MVDVWSGGSSMGEAQPDGPPKNHVTSWDPSCDIFELRRAARAPPWLARPQPQIRALSFGAQMPNKNLYIPVSLPRIDGDVRKDERKRVRNGPKKWQTPISPSPGRRGGEGGRAWPSRALQIWGRENCTYL